ncbi:DUF4306 domain-containing protein [Bacillus sp. BHET2]|uniref:DUF4306 domain-containing protein n=1 Tax=Bacillus sp. BHET2 TaxID=2583818 RepID=UPI00110D3C8C|nr:DUF4306 domain-containing protein [Bacillus sp. BHET2]TMU85214.1 DUF4306 domain-containing protein [Bacillus sp. BHET2]
MYRFVIQLGIGIVFLMFSTLATWYEGAEILDKTYEWKYSTPFSGLVLKAEDISSLDFFVYAIKFKPTFPVVMALSCIYLIITVGYFTFKRKKKVFTTFLSTIAAGLLVLGWQLNSSTTEGALVLSYAFLSCSALCVIATLLYYIRPKVCLLQKVD